jgi:hypothetical protein
MNWRFPYLARVDYIQINIFQLYFSRSWIIFFNLLLDFYENKESNISILSFSDFDLRFWISFFMSWLLWDKSELTFPMIMSWLYKKIILKSTFEVLLLDLITLKSFSHFLIEFLMLEIEYLYLTFLNSHLSGLDWIRSWTRQIFYNSIGERLNNLDGEWSLFTVLVSVP